MKRAARTAMVLALALGACADPVVEPTAAPTVDVTAPGAEQPDPRAEELQSEVTALHATLRAAAAALAAVAAAPDLTAAHAEAEAAVHVLTANPAWAGDLNGDGEVRPLGVAPLLPGPREAIEEDAFYGDQFARTLTAARATGRQGAAVIDALRDPIVGDLGAWQADAAAMLDLIDTVAAPGDLEAVEAGLADLPGAAPRALTYALVALRTPDLDEARTAAERGAAHVELMLTSLEDLATAS